MDRRIFVKRYREAIENGNAAIFAGAGLSRGSGYLDWKSLLKDAAEELGVDITDHTDLVDLAQFYVNTFGNNVQLANAVLNAFKGGVPNENHKILASLPIHYYWTTNYDNLIETTLNDQGKLCDVKSRPSSLSTASNKRDAIVYKMHGDVDCPEDTILTRNQFEDYPKTHESFLNSFTYDLTNRTFLFLGLSFDDPNIKYVFNRVRSLYHENQRTHYCLLKRVATDPQIQKQQDLFVEDLKRYNVQTIYINEFSEITDVLREIRNSYMRRTVFISGAAKDYSPYNEDEFKDFIKKLSATIISKGFRIVTGYGLGIGNEVVDGAVTQLNKEHRSMDQNLFAHPFPQGNLAIKATWHDYRESMISNCGITIFVMGNKIDRTTKKLVPSDGMDDEYGLAQKWNHFLIPVGANGWKAEEYWNNMMSAIATKPGYNGFENDFMDLGDKSKTLDDLIEILNRILDKLK